MRSGVCGAVCRPACGAGKDPENKQPLLCESSSWSYVRVSSAVSSSDAEGERRGCSLRSGGRRVGAAETDGRAGTARRDGGRTLACALLRQARGSARLPPRPQVLARRTRAGWRAAWPSYGAGPRAGARGLPHGHAGLIRAATRPGALGAKARRVARGPSAEGQRGGNSWNGAVWRGRAPARGGGPQAERRLQAWRAMCQRLRGLRIGPVTKPAHAAVRLRSVDSALRTVDLYSNSGFLVVCVFKQLTRHRFSKEATFFSPSGRDSSLRSFNPPTFFFFFF